MTAPCTTTGPYAYDLTVQALWVDSISDVLEPTDVELATGADLQATYNLTDLLNWTIATPILRDDNWSARQGQRIGQQFVLGDSQMVFAASLDGTDIRTLLTRGDSGYIVLLPSGPYLDNPAAPVHVYGVKVAQVSQVHQLRAPGSTIVVTFAISRFIGENVTVVEGS